MNTTGDVKWLAAAEVLGRVPNRRRRLGENVPEVTA